MRKAVIALCLLALCGCQEARQIAEQADGGPVPTADIPTIPAPSTTSAEDGVDLTIDCFHAAVSLSGFDDSDSASFGYGADPPFVVRFSHGSASFDIESTRPTHDQSWSLIIYSSNGDELVRRGGIVHCTG